MVEICPTLIQQVLLLIFLRLFPGVELQQKLCYLFSSLLIVLEQVGLIEVVMRKKFQSCHVCAVGELGEIESGKDVVKHTSEVPVLLLWEIAVLLDELG